MAPKSRLHRLQLRVPGSAAAAANRSGYGMHVVRYEEGPTKVPCDNKQPSQKCREKNRRMIIACGARSEVTCQAGKMLSRHVSHWQTLIVATMPRFTWYWGSGGKRSEERRGG